jgi:hypothetical protein
MMDGRFDQQFAEHFAAPLADESKKSEGPAFWPLALSCIFGRVVFAVTVILA